ncbi:glycosyltransferase family 4 protein [Rubrimonas cliftonensis]|uniref:Glycosyltransferase involved in cell wall bisynthesis n=1 Tax=Rubrimonas cliftonensis TaxID=89524 RepID=A0A1H4CXP5_9RHOB|nr:glycosyltransferase [Rubrimonas cliftonensis]SEA65016.1 Glycosyltransferase involved in cell wall bisynthesis [Rubrimonas cliftonensis]
MPSQPSERRRAPPEGQAPTPGAEFRLRIAVLGTNNDKMYSGGRYHALIMAYVLARAGHDVTVATNRRPIFVDDLEPISPGGVRYAFTPDFARAMPEGAFDYVLLTPTGVFNPVFYENALDFARGAGARLALINFESANWFNATAPEPRDPRLWDYWRRAVFEGGLVISSAMESDRMARAFYAPLSKGGVGFEVCGPAINDVAAAPSLDAPKDGAVVAFVRASDRHKGGADLLRIPPEVLAGRTLRIVSGGPADDDFRRALEARFTPGSGCALAFHAAIPDAEKFRLLAAAQAVLFPSRFEGFGYPPVEACHAGAEVVCYDLPVLRETVGATAHLAPVGDVDALAGALRRALARPERRETLRRSVAGLAGVDAVGARLTDILLRRHDATPVVRRKRHRVLWGPFADAPPARTVRAAADGSLAAAAPGAPASTVTAFHTPAGDVVVSFFFSAPGRVATLREEGGAAFTEVHVRRLWPVGGMALQQATGRLAAEAVGRRLRLTALDASGAAVAGFEVEIARPGPPARVALDMVGVEPDASGATLTWAVDPAGGVTAGAISVDGERWTPVTVEGGRIAARVETPAPHLTGATLYLYGDTAPLGAYGGFPTLCGGQRQPLAAVEPAAPLTPLRGARRGWRHGVALSPRGRWLGALACAPTSAALALRAGSVVAFASGRELTVAAVRRTPRLTLALFDAPVEADADVGSEGDGRAITAHEPAPQAAAFRAEASTPSDGAPPETALLPSWVGGVWRGDGPLSGRCVALERPLLERMLAAGVAALWFAGAGERRVERLFRHADGALAWLDAALPPLVEAAAGSLPADVAPPTAQGRSVAPVDHAGDGRPEPGSLSAARGDILSLPGLGRLRAPGRRRAGGGSGVAPDAAVGDGAAAAGAEPRRLATGALATGALAEGAGAPLVHASPVVSARASRLDRLVDDYRRRGEGRAAAATATAARAEDRPRVLFASLASPTPADQGNRVVTRNLIAHLVGHGFDVDLALVGDADPAAIRSAFGDRVRVFAWPFPEWASTPGAALRRRILRELRDTPFGSMEKELRDALIEHCARHHPYFIVPDAAARMARALFRANAYHSIVCNHTHMARIAEELAACGPLPPTAIVTHDALSRLPIEHEGGPLDTMYRLCAPETERAVLDGAPGAVVVAISRSEADYFRAIGVRNPVELCEYDGFLECRGYALTPRAFDRRRLVFHASGNPMNVAAIRWFEANCWPAILRAAPDARLRVCGGVCRAWRPSTPSVDMRGTLSREALLRELHHASVAINPTLAGTGLKIKTVEAACLGLPGVFLPPAVEGLEDVAEAFGVVCGDARSFVDACVALLTDRDRWEGLRRTALAFSARRFSDEAIYAGLDAHMGWDRGAEARRAAPRPPYAAGPPESEPRETGPGAPGPGDAGQAATLAATLAAGARALAAGDVSAALHHGAVAAAARPDAAAAHALLSRAADAVGDLVSAERARRHALLAAPFAQGPAVAAQTPRGAFSGAEDVVHAAPLGRTFRLPAIVAPGVSPGLGWSHVEKWGAWMAAGYARLALEVDAPAGPLRARLTLNAARGGFLPLQEVSIQADGRPFGSLRLTRDNKTAPIEGALPAAPAGPRRILLEFRVRDPAPFRSADDDRILDWRTLGAGLLDIRLGDPP